MRKHQLKTTRQLFMSKRDVFETATLLVDDIKAIEFLPPVGSDLLTNAKGSAIINRLDKESVKEFGHDTALGRRRKKRQKLSEEAAVEAKAEVKKAKANNGNAKGKSK